MAWRLVASGGGRPLTSSGVRCPFAGAARAPLSSLSYQSMSTTKSGGKFAPGVSGNPAGRPKGARNKITELCADLLGDDAGEIMRECIKHAKKGDAVALRLCVERLVPVRAARDRCVVVDELPDVREAADLVAAAALVISRAAAGAMTLSEAREFMALLSAERALIETQDLAVRVEVLEQQASEGGALAPAAVLDLARRVRRSVIDDESGGYKR